MNTPVTELLAASRDGDAEATQRLVAAVYDELRGLARSARRDHRDHETLNTTGLVHEAYVKLVDGERLPFSGRGHFFGAAARAMRQVLVDDARARRRIKRGGIVRPLPLDQAPEEVAPPESDEILDVDEALDRFAAIDPRAARVVECRYFGGLSVEETAEALGLSDSTVKRDWATARVWLYQALAGSDKDPGPNPETAP